MEDPNNAFYPERSAESTRLSPWWSGEKKFSTHNFLEELEVVSDDVVSGSHGLFPTHQDAGQLGSTMEWSSKRFEFSNPVLSLPDALVEAPWLKLP